jgi:hypothetical protein
MSLTTYDHERNCFVLKPLKDVCPSPFDFEAYMAWQKRHGTDPWKDIKRDASQASKASPVNETKRDLSPRQFHVYAKAEVRK